MDDARPVVEHIDRVRTTLEELRITSTRQHVARISDLILESLAQLLRKQRLITQITIDAESHEVQLTGHDGQLIAAQDLSAGERQLLAVAMLWGWAARRASPSQSLSIPRSTPTRRLASRTFAGQVLPERQPSGCTAFDQYGNRQRRIPPNRQARRSVISASLRSASNASTMKKATSGIKPP